jgi:lysozyme
MPVNKITASKRGKSAIAAVLAAAVAIGGVWFAKGPDGKQYPASVVLAVKEIKKWEGFAPVAYVDRIARPPICTKGYGDTENCHPGDRMTEPQAEALLLARAYKNFYLPMTRCIKDFESMPVSVGASAIMGAYNYGVPRWCHSTAARKFASRRYAEGCSAATAFNRAGGRVINGLVHRREMGDAQRMGEAELCVSGL